MIQVKQKQALGQTNTLPFLLMSLNGISWVMYSFIVKSYYMCFANVASIPLSLYYFGSASLSDEGYSTEIHYALLLHVWNDMFGYYCFRFP